MCVSLLDLITRNWVDRSKERGEMSFTERGFKKLVSIT